jgi:hypothetical protein
LSGFRHRFTYHIRTIPDIQHQLQQIDNIINTELLPALTAGRNLSLQTRLGGLGIPILSDMCAMEFENSKTICQGLTEKIVEQNNVREDIPAEPVQRIRRRVANEREERYKVQLELLRSTMSAEQIRANDLAQLKGSSIWLTALPLADEGYVINKRELMIPLITLSRRRNGNTTRTLSRSNMDRSRH